MNKPAKWIVVVKVNDHDLYFHSVIDKHQNHYVSNVSEATSVDTKTANNLLKLIPNSRKERVLR